MPIFEQHVQNIFSNFLLKIQKNDNFIFEENFQYNIIETSTPEDIATFLNQQIDFLGVHLKGEMFLNLYTAWL